MNLSNFDFSADDAIAQRKKLMKDEINRQKRSCDDLEIYTQLHFGNKVDLILT